MRTFLFRGRSLCEVDEPYALFHAGGDYYPSDYLVNFTRKFANWCEVGRYSEREVSHPSHVDRLSFKDGGHQLINGHVSEAMTATNDRGRVTRTMALGRLTTDYVFVLQGKRRFACRIRFLIVSLGCVHLFRRANSRLLQMMELTSVSVRGPGHLFANVKGWHVGHHAQFKQALHRHARTSNVHFFRRVSNFLDRECVVPNGAFCGHVNQSAIFRLRRRTSNEVFSYPRRVTSAILVRLLSSLHPGRIVPSHTSHVSFNPRLNDVMCGVSQDTSNAFPH